MGYKFGFLNRNGDDGDGPLGQPEATQKTDELLTKLTAEKGRLHAELTFYLFSTRIRLHLENSGPYPDRKGVNALAAMSARLVSAVVEHVWPDTKNEKMDELMADVGALTAEVFKVLRPVPLGAGAPQAQATRH